MTSIENHQTTQVNFVLIPNSPANIYDVGIPSLLEAKLNDIYEDSKPVVTKFPDFLVIYDSKNFININILAGQNRIVIADTRVTPYSGRDLSNFIKFSHMAVNIINQNKIKDYGFNIISTLDLKENDDSGEYIKDKFINQNSLKDLGDLKSAGIRIVYEKDSTRYEIKIDPRTGVDLAPTNQTDVNQNAHFQSSSFPALSDLQKKCQQIYDDFSQNLNTILIDKKE